MKRFIFTALHLISCICLVAQTTKTYTLTFEKDDFIINPIGDNTYTIESKRHDLMLDEETSRPAIPYITTNILLPDFQRISNISFSVEANDTIIHDITLCQNPQICIIGDSLNNKLQTISYPLKKYPFNVKYVKVKNIDGYHIAELKVYPIEYDANECTLVWASSIEISLNLTTQDFENATEEYTHKGTMKNLLLSILHNPEELSDPLTTISEEEQIDYLIITSENMRSSFQKLANWKITKGLQSRIVTMEMINTIFEGETEQLRIKNCLYEYYMCFGTKYALLAGDDTIIPVQGCQGQFYSGTRTVTDNTIPTDLFYTCYKGAFDWNADKDDIIGEITDSADLEPSVYIARLPVSSSIEADIVVNKIINYEQGHSMSMHYLDMLLAGVQCFGSWQKRSDSEITSDKMYEDYIKDYWPNGIRTRFYDTGTDFSLDSLYDVTTEHLQEQLSKGYHFVNVETHGWLQYWNTETKPNYTSTEAYALQNSHPCIITTGACYTNAFDASSNAIYTSDPCLSEAFIRNPNSGVVAYLGGSRQGIGVSNSPTSMGTSIRLTANFYKALFSGESNKFGEMVAIAKSKFGSGATSKWVRFSVNPIGDPEMNIYTDVPQEFSNISYTWNNNVLEINTETPNCTITVTSEIHNDNYYFQTYKDTSTAFFNDLSEGNYTLCVTKKNYRPYILFLSTNNLYIQNEELKGNKNYAGKNVYAGSNVTNNASSGEIIVKSGASVTIKALQNVILDKGFLCEKGAIFEIK